MSTEHRSARDSPVAAVFGEQWPLLVARLVRRTGDLSLAEECAGEAFVEAVATWGSSAPANPGGWLWTVAHRRAVDRLRRAERFATRVPVLAQEETAWDAGPDGERHRDDPVTDHLALLFGCCHPALSSQAQVALMLRYVNGLSSAQIARVLLVSQDTMTRRLTRAKAKVTAARVPFAIPDAEHWCERLDTVLTCIYSTFTVGHANSADHGADLVRGDLCDEARWLVTLVRRVAPADPEALGLAALMAFVDARRPARLDPHGEVVLMEQQDRSRWDQGLIAEGVRLLAQASRQRRLGPFQIEAAIAAQHSCAPSWQDTAWRRIVRLYEVLSLVDPSPVVRLNRAVAVSYLDGPAAGLAELDDLVAEGTLAGYHYLWAARAELLSRLDRHEEAAAATARALECEPHPAEARLLRRRGDRDADGG
ncbi:MAG: RNA polymerase sigma factor [Actinomycetales bacterium]